jgi:hypothetical protein
MWMVSPITVTRVPPNYRYKAVLATSHVSGASSTAACETTEMSPRAELRRNEPGDQQAQSSRRRTRAVSSAGEPVAMLPLFGSIARSPEDDTDRVPGGNFKR